MSSEPNIPEKTEQEPTPVDISSLDLYQLLELVVMLLSEQVWHYIGLQAHPGASVEKKDFVKAHVALDCIISLVDKMEPHIGDEEKERFRRLITELQVAYAEQLK